MQILSRSTVTFKTYVIKWKAWTWYWHNS